MKQVVWHHAARFFVRTLSKEVRREIGALLLLLQEGEVLGFPVSRKMSSIHRSALELRLADREGEIRVIYALILKDKVLIPHVFRKRSQKTPGREIQTAKVRLQGML